MQDNFRTRFRRRLVLPILGTESLARSSLRSSREWDHGDGRQRRVSSTRSNIRRRHFIASDFETGDKEILAGEGRMAINIFPRYECHARNSERRDLSGGSIEALDPPWRDNRSESGAFQATKRVNPSEEPLVKFHRAGGDGGGYLSESLSRRFRTTSARCPSGCRLNDRRGFFYFSDASAIRFRIPPVPPSLPAAYIQGLWLVFPL